MSSIRLLINAFLVVPLFACAESNYWDHIQKLSKHSVPQGDVQLEAYLKGLTPTEMLQAVRQCAQYVEKKFPEKDWEASVVNVALVLTFYGTSENGITDDRLNGLLKCMTDGNEGRFFRESLILFIRQRYWKQLTVGQRTQCKVKFLEMLADRKSPVRLRAASCRELSLAIAENHRNIITSDNNVRPLRGDRPKWWNLDDLIRKGEVRLDPETRKALKTLRDETEKIAPTLTALAQDATEAPEVRDRAKAALKTFADLPDAPEP